MKNDVTQDHRHDIMKVETAAAFLHFKWDRIEIISPIVSENGVTEECANCTTFWSDYS